MPSVKNKKGEVALKRSEVPRATLGRIPSYLKYLKSLPQDVRTNTNRYSQRYDIMKFLRVIDYALKMYIKVFHSTGSQLYNNVSPPLYFPGKSHPYLPHIWDNGH